MCGISGIFNFSTNSNLEEEVRKMTNAIIHRGPDGLGHWINSSNQIALGHRRLSIIDLSENASQPMHLENRYTLTFNGEIYNYLELRESLVKEGFQFKTQSDTEVLLTLYSEYQEKCLDLLDGMFAFAIWDEIEQTLFCARDRFGEKPFHYCIHNDNFYFSSEIKSFWAVGVPKIKNPQLFNHFENTGHSYLPDSINETFFQGIYRLEHAHFLKVSSDGELKIQRYYDIDWKNQNCKLSFEDACVEFDRLFQLSLSRRFRSDVPVGTSLSGGLDSSSIVCNMPKYLDNKNIKPITFSARFKNFKKDEGKFIDAVISKTHFINHSTWPSGPEMLNDMEQLCYFQDEPFGSASIYAQYRVQKLALEHNVTVLIDGQGADEILGGYISYYPEYLNSLFHSRSTFSRFRMQEQHKFIDYHTPHSTLKKAAIKWSNYYEFRGHSKKKGNQKSLNELLYNSTMKGDLQELLRFADRNSMANHREVRLPFLFHELVEFCFTLPDEYKLRLGWTKYLMRKTFEPILPAEICWRKEKVGFEPPQLNWLSDLGKEGNWSKFVLNYFE